MKIRKISKNDSSLNDYDFSAERLAAIARMEKDHFWFVGRRKLLDKLIAKHFKEVHKKTLDLGCGTGLNCRILNRKGLKTIGTDLRPEGLKEVGKRLPESSFVRSKAEILPFKSGSFDALIMLDVLEHVDDDSAGSEIHRILGTDGLAIITVPAIRWLWSFRDDDAGHKRRYTRKTLKHILETSGFEIVHLRYFQFLLFPLAVVFRLIGRRKHSARDMEETPNVLINWMFTRINFLEVYLGNMVPFPWGTSLIAVCKK